LHIPLLRCTVPVTAGKRTGRGYTPGPCGGGKSHTTDVAKSPKAPRAPKEVVGDGTEQVGTDALIGVQFDGSVPSSRLRDAASLKIIYNTLKICDEEASRNRAAADAMFDGEPPYDDEELVASGQAQRCNLDFGEGAAMLEMALTGYYDLTNSVDVLARIQTSFGDDAGERSEWEQVMSEEVDRTLHEWSEFEPTHQRNCTEFVKHGVGIAFHTDDANWQFDVTGLSGFYIPRATRVGENNMEMAIAERTYQLHELYAYISDPGNTDPGWNVEEVQKALAMATRDGNGTRTWRQDWEKLQRDFKDNDIGVGYGRQVTIEVIHAWVREFSGKVSHYISLQNGQNVKFLYEKKDRFATMADCFTIFTYGIGNGYYHSIRGLGFKVFSQIQVSNRLRGQAVDGAMFASSVMVQPESEKALQALELTYVGPFSVLAPGYKVINHAMPNVGAQVMPVIQDLSLLVQNNIGSYRPRGVSEQPEKTAEQDRREAQDEATLSASAMNLFYQPWGRLLWSVVKRLFAGTLRSRDKGGPEAIDLIKRCRERGVPLEAMKAIISVKPTRAIGYGSAAIRGMAFDQMIPLAGALDEIGKNRLLRDKFASMLGGYHNVDAYIPRAQQHIRLPVDAQIATIENAVMQDGATIPVQDGQNDAVHASIHLPPILDASKNLLALQQNAGGLDTGQAQPILLFLHSSIPHTAQHVQRLLEDPLHKAEAKQAQHLLQVADQQLMGATESFQKAQQAQQDAAQKAGQQQQAPDPRVQKMLAESQTKIQIAQQEAQQRLAIRAAEAQQKLQIESVKAMQHIGHRHLDQLQAMGASPMMPNVQPPRGPIGQPNVMPLSPVPPAPQSAPQPQPLMPAQ